MTADGQDPYARWLAELANRPAGARIVVRVNRLAAGNFGGRFMINSCFDPDWTAKITS